MRQQRHYRYATITIPARATFARASDHAPGSSPVPITVRARLSVNRRNEPIEGAAWFFSFGAYAWYVSRSLPGLTATDERFVKVGR